MKRLLFFVLLTIFIGCSNTVAGQIENKLLEMLPPETHSSDTVRFINKNMDYSFGNVLAWDLTNVIAVNGILNERYALQNDRWVAITTRSAATGSLLFINVKIDDKCFLGQKGWYFGTPVMVYGELRSCDEFDLESNKFK